MKKILLILLTGVILSGCYTTFYPSEAMNMGGAEAVPDSTRQIIINNYYETTEYYQVPHYRRYSLIWGGYYWDPFYYDYSYYSWRPYYWYGNYYYYNPHNHYWYYYDHNYWYSGSGSGGSSGGNGDKGRVHKPGYNELMSSPTGTAPFVSIASDNGRVNKPAKKVGVNVNSGLSNDNTSYHPQIQSVGKKQIGTTSSPNKSTNLKKATGLNHKSSVTSSNTKISSSSTVYKSHKQSSSSSSSSSDSKSKSSTTNGSSSKSSRSESTSSKKSK